MDVIQDLKNKLLSRRELKFITPFTKNPSFAEIEELVSKEFKAEPEKIAVKAIKGKFGHDTFLVEALIYDNLAAREKHEPKKKVKKVA